MTHALPLRRIVVGVDGSAASAAAVRWAGHRAARGHRRQGAGTRSAGHGG